MKITIVVFCYIVQLYYIYAVVKVQQRQLDFDGQDLIFGHESFKDGKLTYAACMENDTIHEMVCKVVREKEPLSNDTFSCNVTLKILVKKGNDPETDDMFGIVPFGRDKAVLYIIQHRRHTKARFNTIQFDGCKVIEKNITVSNFIFAKYNVVIVPYNNSYDVVYPSVSSGFQKMTINKHGERINGPIALGYYLWLAHFPYILPVSQRSRSKGFVYLDFVDDFTLDEYDLVLWKPGSVETSFGKHKIGFRTIKSTSHDLIGICNDVNNSISFMKCTQYDANGKLMFETDSMGDENQSIAFIDNAAGGGFFLLGGKPTNDTGHLDLFVTKLDSTGKNNGTLNIGKIKLKAEALVASFYKYGESDCVSVTDYNAINVRSINQSRLYYIDQTAYCFNNSDFV